MYRDSDTTYDKFDYNRARRAGYGAKDALRLARLIEEWKDAERAGLVQLRVEPDNDPDASQCDCGDKHCRHNELLERDGAFGTIGEYRDASGEWAHADSCWGHVGYADPADPIENDYAADAMRSALDLAYAAALTPRHQIAAKVGASDPADLPAFAWPGGYPLAYYTADGAMLCHACANGKNGSESANPLCQDESQWRLADGDVYWEGPSVPCEHCGATIESAYRDPDAPEPNGHTVAGTA